MRDRQDVAAVGGALEALLDLGSCAVRLHALLDPLLAHADAPEQQFLPGPRPAVADVRFGVDDEEGYCMALRSRSVERIQPTRAGRGRSPADAPPKVGCAQAERAI